MYIPLFCATLYLNLLANCIGIAVQLHILLVFDLNSVEIVGTVDHQHHPQAAKCGCVQSVSLKIEIHEIHEIHQNLRNPVSIK